MVFVGVGFVYCLDTVSASTGTAGGWGENYYGQLGIGPTDSHVGLVAIDTPDSVSAVSGGCWHSLFLLADQSILAAGHNGWGQLGNDSTSNSNTLVPVSAIDDALAVAAGCYHGLALRADHTVWAWGNNNGNQLGAATLGVDDCPGYGGGGGYCHPTPVPVAGLADVEAIAAGITFNAALKSDGSVWVWGRLSGTTSQPQHIAGLSGIVAIDAGSYHLIALKSDGTVWTWGQNHHGQLGNGNTVPSLTPLQVGGLSDVVAVAGGGWHSLALRADGTVWAWGRNTEGQVGNGTLASPIFAPTQVVNLDDAVDLDAGVIHTVALRSDGTLYAWGNGRTSPTQVGSLSGATGIVAGGYHGLALAAVNSAPLASAGGPYSGREGSPIPLSGASASDSDGDTLTFTWSVD